jgi:ATP-dependent DNA ligase
MPILVATDREVVVMDVEQEAGRPARGIDGRPTLKPVLVAQIEFLEWTGENHLRHTKFIALREDKPARDVRRE